MQRTERPMKSALSKTVPQFGHLWMFCVCAFACAQEPLEFTVDEHLSLKSDIVLDLMRALYIWTDTVICMHPLRCSVNWPENVFDSCMIDVGIHTEPPATTRSAIAKVDVLTSWRENVKMEVRIIVPHIRGTTLCPFANEALSKFTTANDLIAGTVTRPVWHTKGMGGDLLQRYPMSRGAHWSLKPISYLIAREIVSLICNITQNAVLHAR